MNYTVVSKRKIGKLIAENIVRLQLLFLVFVFNSSHHFLHLVIISSGLDGSSELEYKY